ncbi:signal peptidase II [Limibacterium fermenti]|jgi:hypothetical protein|uniref:signal peptidase II n=1 Tax=Limibacterium fermenti TaxID=3229863 RepID=UPI003A6F42A2
MKINKIIFITLFFTLLDQLIKIIINIYFFECRFIILNPILEFHPTFNNKYSYLNHLLHNKFNIDLGMPFHLILNIITFIVIILLYYYLRNLQKTRLLDISFIFAFSGIISVLISTYIWENGCLDYIYLKPLFVFDLKDIYLNCFAILFLIYLNKNKAIINIKGKKLF